MRSPEQIAWFYLYTTQQRCCWMNMEEAGCAMREQSRLRVSCQPKIRRFVVGGKQWEGRPSKRERYGKPSHMLLVVFWAASARRGNHMPRTESDANSDLDFPREEASRRASPSLAYFQLRYYWAVCSL